MRALADDPQLTALEKKLDRGFAETRTQIISTERTLRGEILSVRTDARADFRTLLAVVVAMSVTTVLAVVGVLLAHL